MKGLNILTLCLLVSFKSISQNVILSQNQAARVITDLHRYDDLKFTDQLKDEEIRNYKDIVASKDYIISQKDKIISKQDDIISKIKMPKLHFGPGLQYNNTTDLKPYLYLMLDWNKINISTRYYIGKQREYSINLEYRVF